MQFKTRYMLVASDKVNGALREARRLRVYLESQPSAHPLDVFH